MTTVEAPQESVARYILRDSTFTSSRRPMHMSSLIVGDQLFPQQKISGPMPLAQSKARPLSASVQANAWKAYGSPRAKGQIRALPVPDKMHPNPKSVMDSMTRRPASVLTLGGGYQLPRPQTAPTANPPRLQSRGGPSSPRSPPRTPQSLSHRISGDQIEAPPSMSHPMTADLLYPKEQFTEEFRLTETLPTDPKALGVWQTHLRHNIPSFARPSTSSRPRTAAPSLSDHHQPTSGPVRSSSGRFSSMSLRTMHNMGSTFKPTLVTGHSQPESEIHLPEKSALRYSRMGQTSMSYMYKNMKMAGGHPSSAPNSMNPIPSHWPMSQNRQSPTKWGHDQDSHNGIFYISENDLSHRPSNSPDLTVSGNIMHPQVHSSDKRPSSGNDAKGQPNSASHQHALDMLEEHHLPKQHHGTTTLSSAPVPTISECEFETPAATVLLDMPLIPTISLEVEEDEDNLVQEDEDVGNGPEDEAEAIIMRVSQLSHNNAGDPHTNTEEIATQSTVLDKKESELHLQQLEPEDGAAESHFSEAEAVKLQHQAVGKNAFSMLYNQSTDLQDCDTDIIESRQQIVVQTLTRENVASENVKEDAFAGHQDSEKVPDHDGEEENALTDSLKNLAGNAGSRTSSRPSSNTRPTSARPNSRPMSACPVSGGSSGRSGTSSPDRPSTAACNDITLGVIGEETVKNTEGN